MIKCGYAKWALARNHPARFAKKGEKRKEEKVKKKREGKRREGKRREGKRREGKMVDTVESSLYN